MADQEIEPDGFECMQTALGIEDGDAMFKAMSNAMLLSVAISLKRIADMEERKMKILEGTPNDMGLVTALHDYLRASQNK